MKNTCIFLILLLFVSLLAFGCGKQETVVKTLANQSAGQQLPGQQPTGQQNQTQTQQAQQPAAETQKEEQTFPLQYNLGQLSEFLPNMDYLIGANAPASDVLAVTNTKTYLIYKKIETGEAKLTNEIENYKRDDYIIVGSPCNNPAAADLFSSEIGKKGDCKIFPAEEGVIKLKAVSNNHYMLYIGGNTPADTTKAMKVLQYFGNYTLSGTEARVRGTAEAPIVAVVQQ